MAWRLEPTFSRRGKVGLSLLPHGGWKPRRDGRPSALAQTAAQACYNARPRSPHYC